jgi:translation initiation factor 2 subunit 2
MTEDYEKLLQEAYKDIKPVESKIDRFEVPTIAGHIEGNKTILTNFKQIAAYIRRNEAHFLKYLLKALAAAGSIKGDRVILTRKISSKLINEKIQQYAQEFVLCKECGKPDTEILKQDRLSFVHCLACGAKHSISSKV